MKKFEGEEKASNSTAKKVRITMSTTSPKRQALVKN